MDLYVNHPVTALGSPDWISTDLKLADASAASNDTHVLVRVQPQTALIRVRLFQDHGGSIASDPSFTTVVDGSLYLADRRFVIGDVMGESRFIKYIGGPQRWRVRVAVDDPKGHARAADAALEPRSRAAGVSALRAAALISS
ncbi:MULTISPECIES: hypothetical protein [Streptomyces]|uniref:hypothetical protein n=1 Tax=Streptomyces TaxID=1883 RepID=UPI00164719B0|nr:MULTISPECIES: hypothetical protein [Streptomyces]MBT3074022.1 hypothetical protein [Streptomyces sp. COG21]MBT3083932.1 hypothetical protein [Streptomyces sp. COG20]MBT3090233.1 hypothetical protein [Streptomyces sp. CYG21]MBT3098626.1 hypothetical protein [Streptomyces sp. CBG30]MBT3101425.1 hypothetical protein [Streptomyces sp. COG19]